ncbi:response regulator [Bacillus sp. CECT 9360]|uniref:response regulator n=1 Tax=Bacillus sp. CECT 9360 TaxID=2845821 RepID=UPI001EF9C7B0|nr:response regulator [Bacillus sp. CECT 9360]CAH0345874.1 Chemotaxis protein CheY [Bacillus sp. CECT 9360]
MKNILLADDSRFMRMILKRKLDANNFSIIAEAVNGLDAIEKYKNFNPDIVLMDVTMPIISGTEALKEIIRYDQQAKIVMCSALGTQPLIKESLRLGAKDFIVKPFFDNLNKILNNQ